MTTEQDPVGFEPDPKDAPRPKPVPRIDEDALEEELGVHFDDWLAANPFHFWRRDASYLVLVEGRYMKLQRWKFYAGMAHYMRSRGYAGRGIMHELVLVSVREGLERREVR